MKQKKRPSDEEQFLKLFPSRFAWKAADEAVDKLSIHDPMALYVDEWIRAYKAAGGRTNVA